MFYTTEAVLLDDSKQPIQAIYIDLQPFSKIIHYDNGIELEVAYRAFCEPFKGICEKSFFLINEELYKVMKVKVWTDYMELYLYKCKN